MSSADLKGAARDPAKALIAGVVVTVTNTATNISRSTVTGAGGDYRIPLLPPGEYEIKAEMNGFTTQIRRGVTLTVGQTMVINFDLQVGQVATQVEVISGETPVIETERTQQADTLTERPIQNLPINGRNFLSFALLTPGVVEENPAFTDNLPRQIPTTQLNFAGQNGRANSVTIDGVDNNDIAANGVRPTVSQEAVQEFQINRSNFNAEFGRAGGGHVNIVSKSGANQFQSPDRPPQFQDGRRFQPVHVRRFSRNLRGRRSELLAAADPARDGFRRIEHRADCPAAQRVGETGPDPGDHYRTADRPPTVQFRFRGLI